MPEPVCLHEVDLSLIQKDCETLKESIADIKKDTKSIIKSITGNGGEPGIKTQVELNKQAIKRAWWFLGAISLAIITAAISLGCKVIAG